MGGSPVMAMRWDMQWPPIGVIEFLPVLSVLSVISIGLSGSWGLPNDVILGDPVFGSREIGFSPLRIAAHLGFAAILIGVVVRLRMQTSLLHGIGVGIRVSP